MERPVTHPLDDLVVTLRGETERILELKAALVRQREHVARQDPAAVAAGADEISRLLLAVDETRKQRLATVALLASDPGTPLGRLAARLNVRPTPAFERARLDLEQAAHDVQREAAINHQVLRRAVESGEAFLQSLFSSVGSGDTTYRPEGREDAGPSGVILNRTA